MKGSTKLVGFGVALTAVFGAALFVGARVGPDSAGQNTGGHGHVEGDADAGMGGDMGVEAPGLAVSADGYTLVPATTVLPSARSVPFSFQVTGPDGKPSVSFATEHEKEMHLIVVRRDLAGYQHVHPVMAADGTWSVPLTLPLAGSYKVFADFRPAGHSMPIALATDLFVSGEFAPSPLPPAAETANVDGYAVTLAGQLTVGRESDLTFTVTQNGTPVTDLEPYLGAFGHLVALRAGDLAYLHVHPAGDGDHRAQGGPAVGFRADVPTGGQYRLFLDFQHRGVVHTAEFTAIAKEAAK